MALLTVENLTKIFTVGKGEELIAVNNVSFAHREAHGVEPICKVLPIAPSTYYDHVARRRDPARLSARAKRDMALKVEVRRVFEENFRVYGVRKAWRQLQREGFDVARSRSSAARRWSGCAGRAASSAPGAAIGSIACWRVGVSINATGARSRHRPRRARSSTRPSCR